MKKISALLNKIKLNNKGVTLVELVVTFTIMAIFMVCASHIMISTMNIYYQIKGTANGLQVTSLIEKQIAGDLSAALDNNLAVYGNNNTCKGASIVIYDSGKSIEFIDKKNNRVKISKDKNGYINYHYYEVYEENSEGNSVRGDAYDWKLYKKQYMGYKIQSINFSKANAASYKDNVIVMTIVLRNEKYGEYESRKYIECFNFDSSSENSSIVVK